MKVMNNEKSVFFKTLLANQNFDRNNLPLFDLHLHTNWTDGKNSVSAMYSEAVKYGLKYILFSEHVRMSSDKWFLKFANEVRECKNINCLAFVGIETKIINFNGELDVSSFIVENCDSIMASVHRFPGEEGIINKNLDDFIKNSSYDDPINTEYKLANLILENSQVNILGHPFGMSYKRFKLNPPRKKIIDLIKKAAKMGVAFEINSRYHPDLWDLIDLCKKHEAIISLGSNAHSIVEVGAVISQLKNEASCATN